MVHDTRHLQFCKHQHRPHKQQNSGLRQYCTCHATLLTASTTYCYKPSEMLLSCCQQKGQLRKGSFSRSYKCPPFRKIQPNHSVYELTSMPGENTTTKSSKHNLSLYIRYGTLLEFCWVLKPLVVARHEPGLDLTPECWYRRYPQREGGCAGLSIWLLNWKLALCREKHWKVMGLMFKGSISSTQHCTSY